MSSCAVFFFGKKVILSITNCHEERKGWNGWLQLSARLMTAESLSDSSFAKQKQLEAQNKKLQSELEVREMRRKKRIKKWKAKTDKNFVTKSKHRTFKFAKKDFFIHSWWMNTQHYLIALEMILENFYFFLRKISIQESKLEEYLLAECSERDRGLEEAGGGLAETGRGRAPHAADCSAESQESRGGPRFPQVAARSGKEEVRNETAALILVWSLLILDSLTVHSSRAERKS